MAKQYGLVPNICELRLVFQLTFGGWRPWFLNCLCILFLCQKTPAIVTLPSSNQFVSSRIFHNFTIPRSILFRNKTCTYWFNTSKTHSSRIFFQRRYIFAYYCGTSLIYNPVIYKKKLHHFTHCPAKNPNDTKKSL